MTARPTFYAALGFILLLWGFTEPVAGVIVTLGAISLAWGIIRDGAVL